MNVQLRDRPEPAASANVETAIADCDIHPARATRDELYPYLAKRWHAHLETYGVHVGANHNNGPFRRQSGSSGKNVPYEGAACNPVHNFRQGGFHPRSHAGRQNDKRNFVHLKNLPCPRNPLIFEVFKTIV